jgi:hypothetical protein
MFVKVDEDFIELEVEVSPVTILERPWNIGKTPKTVPTDTSFQRVSTDSHGYKIIYQPDHPLSRSDGTIFRHRALVYDLIGPGGHSCTHCGIYVTWDFSCPEKGSLVVDHLDWNPSNNELSNLVVSCQPCNSKRRKPKP